MLFYFVPTLASYHYLTATKSFVDVVLLVPLQSRPVPFCDISTECGFELGFRDIKQDCQEIFIMSNIRSQLLRVHPTSVCFD